MADEQKIPRVVRLYIHSALNGFGISLGFAALIREIRAFDRAERTHPATDRTL